MGLLTDTRITILPAAAKIGDQIAAFYGGRCLYLLRPLINRDTTYTFVGEFYVDGLMDGEFLPAIKQMEHDAQILTLV